MVGGEIYVLQKDQLSWLPDSNKDGTADQVKKVASGWTVQPGPKNLEFAMGMVYRDSVFYGGLATAWPLNSTQTDERGCVIQMSTQTGGIKPYACGMRTPNGLTLGPENELFTTENQGNWVPSSKLLHIKQGHFYGVHKTVPGPFDKIPETPPALWLDHGAIAISPTQPVYVKTGVYSGQMIAGDNNMGTLQRYFLEKVGGEFQGAVFKFSGGLEAAANRIITGPDGAWYVGGIGTSDWSGWDWAGKDFGLQRMVPNGKKVFEMLAVRSKGSTSLEVEFTTPVGAGADVAANYQVKQWFYIPVLTYGAGKQTVENLAVKSAVVSSDKLKVTLEITGMKLKNVVYIKLGAVKSADNADSWTTETWYTQNAFGPGTDVVTTGAVPEPKAVARIPMEARTLGAGKIAMRIPTHGSFTLDIVDPQGRIRESKQGIGPMEWVSQRALETGVYILSLKDAAGISRQRVVCP